MQPRKFERGTGIHLTYRSEDHNDGYTVDGCADISAGDNVHCCYYSVDVFQVSPFRGLINFIEKSDVSNTTLK